MVTFKSLLPLELEIKPLKVPVPLSLPTDKVIAEPPPASEKSTVPVPVRIPVLIVGLLNP